MTKHTHTGCEVSTSKCFINQEGIDVGLFSERRYGLMVSSDMPAESFIIAAVSSKKS